VIKYALVCGEGHTFESWFQNATAYDRQARRGLVACPACNSTSVEKAVMAPRIVRKDGGSSRPTAAERGDGAAAPEGARASPPAPVAMLGPEEREFRRKLRELRDHLVRNADNVGAKFPDEARAMHYGDIEHRSIYGEASPQEADALREEGIEVHPLPLLPEDRN
jgi:hypothetical protein